MTTRTDIHAPSSPDFDPETYTCHGVFDLSPEWGSPGRAQVVSRLVDAGYHFTSVHGIRQCGHCGQGIRYAALMTHEPTKGMIYVGETCLSNRFEALTKAQFQALREQARLNRERVSKREKISALLEAHPVLVWASYAFNIGEAGVETEMSDEYTGSPIEVRKPGTAWIEKVRAGWEISTLTDIWWKIERYADPSEKQIAFVESLVNKLSQKQAWQEEREAKAAALKASGVQAPEGRVQVTGTVVSTKWYDNNFGGSLKMLVALADGTKVWGTVPSSLDVDKDDEVTFTATFERKADDPTFATYKRPSKASVTHKEEVQA